MKSWPVVVFGAALVLLSPSLADEAATPAPSADAKAAAQPDPEEMICMRTKRTGSNMPGPQICKARKIWQQQHKDSQDLLNQQQKNGLLSQPAGG